MDNQSLSSSVAKFSAKFCNELNQSQSVVASPLSAKFLLALLTLGSEDPAHSELLSSLGISSDDEIRSSFKSLSQNLLSIKGVTLNVANKVYIKEGDYDLNEDLKKDAVSVFNAAFEKVDFSQSKAAANLINKWVEDQTNNKIRKLIPADSLNAGTSLVLVNAIYFKGPWRSPFDPLNTSDQPFHISPSETVDVPMMYKEDDFFYSESKELNAQLLCLEYVKSKASMLIVLPEKIDGLNEVLAKLADGYDLIGDVRNMFKKEVQVTIPKFKIETEIDLAELLPKLGIQSIFDQNNSGLTKILNNSEPLSVSKAVQKAFIEVNEEGAEAAAASAMVMVGCCLTLDEPQVIKFTADRPFFVAIISNETIYFTATYRGN
ncbi:serpin-2 [Danaus plexippus plexippus]|uniref:Serpin-2 n=2 Tax=Danaus plexippus plexippus TaxID=278856 RepID=A0A212EXP2_DANPL|nr:antitrypsin-like [Danaus plexippus plexippus]OWR46227.1 serpin-2 [Danaus plexippus plexippus]